MSLSLALLHSGSFLIPRMIYGPNQSIRIGRVFVLGQLPRGPINCLIWYCAVFCFLPATTNAPASHSEAFVLDGVFVGCLIINVSISQSQLMFDKLTSTMEFPPSHIVTTTHYTQKQCWPFLPRFWYIEYNVYDVLTHADIITQWLGWAADLEHPRWWCGKIWICSCLLFGWGRPTNQPTNEDGATFLASWN